MKKIYSLLFSLLPLAALTQTIPNGGFENWTNTPVLFPQYYPMNSNIEMINNYAGALPFNITRVTDAQLGTYAAKLETVANATDTMFAYFINGDPGTLKGGIAITGTPTSLNGYYKCNVQTNDTALVLVIFKKLGSPIGMFMQKIYGVQSTYTSFTLPISLPMAPDTVIFGAVSSNAFAGQGIPGSMLQIDNVTLGGIATQPPMLNGNFENWDSRSFYKPDQWVVVGDTAHRSTSAYAGSYALQLRTIAYSPTDAGSSFVTNGTYNNSTWMITGGKPFTSMSDTLCGYYKFIPVGTDSASVWINLTNNGTPVGGNFVSLPPASTYTYFEVGVNASSTPDTLLFVANSTNGMPNVANNGSVFLLDNLYLKGEPLGFTNVDWKNIDIKLYPNPTDELLYVTIENSSVTPTEILIRDITGRIITQSNFSSSLGNTQTIDVSNFEAGTYLLIVKQDKKQYLRNFIVK